MAGGETPGHPVGGEPGGYIRVAWDVVLVVEEDEVMGPHLSIDGYHHQEEGNADPEVDTIPDAVAGRKTRFRLRSGPGGLSRDDAPLALSSAFGRFVGHLFITLIEPQCEAGLDPLLPQ